MLRGLVLLFVLLNAALYFWLQAEPHALQADREPQRLGRQVAPDKIQVLPDLPGASGAVAPASAAASAAATDGPNAAAAADGKVVPAVVAAGNGANNLECSESGPLDDAQYTALRQLLVKDGLSANALAERRQPEGGRWMVYLGRFADAQAWQQKADELRRLDVKFERVNTPAALAPGLSLGAFDSATDAGRRLDELTKQGVHTARVVVTRAATLARHLQVRAADNAWRLTAGEHSFTACPLNGPPTL